MSEQLVIRADATAQIGTGHVMRCLALAQAWDNTLQDVVFIGRITVEWLKERLKSEGAVVHYLADELPLEEEPQQVLNQLSEYNSCWVVLDGYHFSYQCQLAIKNVGFHLLVIDDYNHLDTYCCDILLNQNIGAEKFVYHGEIGKIVRGVEHALIRSEFLALANHVTQREEKKTVQNVLVTLGGGDIAQHLELLVALKDTSSDLCLRIVSGATSPKILSEFFEGCSASVEILDNVFDMPQQMLWCDVCVTAGGSTCWELAFLKIPFAVFSVAENQNEIVRYLLEHDVAKDWHVLRKQAWLDPTLWRGKKLPIAPSNELLSTMLNMVS